MTIGLDKEGIPIHRRFRGEKEEPDRHCLMQTEYQGERFIVNGLMIGYDVMIILKLVVRSSLEENEDRVAIFNHKCLLICMRNDSMEHLLTPEAEYWIAFATIQSIGAQKLKKLHAHFGSIKEAWKHGSDHDYLKAGIDEASVRSISRHKTRYSPEHYLEILERERVSLISFLDNEYPPQLKETPDHPAILFCRGDLSLLHARQTLGVVGTRKMSQYGKDAVATIIPSLATAGVTIISGMAMGIDGLVHQTTLDAGGKTIAVLASGVNNDSLYPKINYHLGQQIIARGLMISEFPPGTQPRDYFFPLRNRIIAGLSRGVLIIEAPEKSGTLLTANYALEYNRDVFAVPNPITSPNAAAPNGLIKKGAQAVERAEDVFQTWGLDVETRGTLSSGAPPETSEEQLLYSLLSSEPLHIDEITRQSNLDASKISVIVTLMEMKGLIKRMEGGYYRKT